MAGSWGSLYRVADTSNFEKRIATVSACATSGRDYRYIPDCRCDSLRRVSSKDFFNSFPSFISLIWYNTNMGPLLSLAEIRDFVTSGYDSLDRRRIFILNIGGCRKIRDSSALAQRISSLLTNDQARHYLFCSKHDGCALPQRREITSITMKVGHQLGSRLSRETLIMASIERV